MRASSLPAGLALSFALCAAACDGVHAVEGPATSGAATGQGGAASSEEPTEVAIGGDRPTTLYLPESYAKGTPAPLLLMLHGYAASGPIEELYLGMKSVAAAKGFLYAHPDGTADAKGYRFWNATDDCCNFDGSTVDDSAYLAGLIEEIRGKVDVDPKRIYVVGHSNGGYMSYRMACDHADVIAAVASLAGATWLDATKCSPKGPVSVLEVHGTADMEVAYDGTATCPSAPATVKTWATYDGCDGTRDDLDAKDLEKDLAGAETKRARYAKGCEAGSVAELWTVEGGSHLPAWKPEFLDDFLGFLLAHPKP